MNPIVSVDDEYDRDNASDGISRFAGYVRQRAHLFVDDWEPLSPVTFAVTVWSIATSPVMTPPYARVSPRVWDIECRHGDESHLLDPPENGPGALFSTHLRVPIAEDLLPVPCRFGALDVSVAKRAVSAIADQVNAVAGPVVAQLRDTDAIGAGR